MKNHSSTSNALNLGPQLWHGMSQVTSFFSDCASRFYKGILKFKTTIQRGRMESVLDQMSDKQLAQAGITRSEIKRHAKYLIEHEYDGL